MTVQARAAAAVALNPLQAQALAEICEIWGVGQLRGLEYLYGPLADTPDGVLATFVIINSPLSLPRQYELPRSGGWSRI